MASVEILGPSLITTSKKSEEDEREIEVIVAYNCRQ